MFWSRPTPPIRATGLLDEQKRERERESGKTKRKKICEFFLKLDYYITQRFCNLTINCEWFK
jgi:hypothetical protein